MKAKVHLGSILTAILMLTSITANTRESYSPVPDGAAVVTFGNARFTVLTDRLIRMEWAENGRFEDRATLGIVNRRLPVPAFEYNIKGKKLSLSTGKLTLTYKDNGKFDGKNLSVHFLMPGDKAGKMSGEWHPGKEDKGNLLGTARTLDRCGNREDVLKGGEMDKGVISRDGWALIDESTRHLLVKDVSDWGEWVAPRPEGDRQDFYLFAYGHDYLQAVQDFTKIAGKVPMLPKYVFGFWQSRYWSYADYEFLGMARKMRREDIPADVMIIDMDWHETWSLWDGERIKDEFGQRTGWTGYTWNKRLFPDPEACLSDLHALHFKTALNLHPAGGIHPYEEPYAAFVEDYLGRTGDYDGPEGYVYGAQPWHYAGTEKPVGKPGQKAPVPFRISQKAWADAYFHSVLHPLEAQGVDFWWLDWQQFKTSRYLPDLNITFWLNHCFFKDKERQGGNAPRPLIYHRWGGIGSHRYQLGFSGDTEILWSALEMTPWFTATASNVCYGYWGHDLGGHMLSPKERSLGTNAELFLRWMQYGVFTPIFKVHSGKSADIERRIWNYPAFTDFFKAAIRLRYDLSRYIYDCSRYCHDTGLSMVRPLYWYHPESPQAYAYDQEHYFGDRILATVLCKPADTATGLTARSVWFPEDGDWYDMTTGQIYPGGSEVQLYYALNENPWFVKAGSVLPLAAEGISNLQEPSNALRLLVVPGNGYSAYTTYEDDGISQACDTQFATTLIEKRADDALLRLDIDARKGSYAGMSDKRRISVVLDGFYAPLSVKVNGSDCPWRYDGAALAVCIDLPETDASEPLAIECRFDPRADRSLLRGKKGLFGRIRAVTDEVKTNWPNPAIEFLDIAAVPSRLSSNPRAAQEILKGIDVNAMNEGWKRNAKLPKEFVSRMRALSRLSD